MSTIVTRAGKGTPLTHAEVDANFTNLDADKLDTAGIALGSAASPTIKFTGDSNTGIYSPGADQLSVATGGVQRLRIDSAGNVNVTTASLAQYFGINATGTAASVANGLFAPTGNTLGFVTNVTERARIDSNGRLLVGTSSSSALIRAAFQANSGNAGGAGVIHLQRGEAAATITVDETLGVLRGTDNADNIGAEVIFTADAAWGTGDYPGRIVFSTTADGASTPTERMRIDNAGNITTSTGILTLGATGGEGGQLVINNTTNTGGVCFLDAKDDTTARLFTFLNNSTLQIGQLVGTGGNVQLWTGATERARIDSSGRLLVGTSSTRNVGAVAHPIQNETPSGTIAGLSIVRNSADVAEGRITFGKTRSTTVGGTTSVASGDFLGTLAFAGANGTDLNNVAATISVVVDGDPTGSTTDLPGRIVFSTTPDGTASSTERLRITNDGVQAYNQPAPAAVNATATLTAANLKAGIITSTSAAATDMTLPTGTDTQAGFSGTYDSMTFEWSVINTGPSLVRVLAGTAHTVVGSGSVATGTSGRFASRRTAANTFVTYRLT